MEATTGVNTYNVLLNEELLDEIVLKCLCGHCGIRRNRVLLRTGELPQNWRWGDSSGSLEKLSIVGI